MLSFKTLLHITVRTGRCGEEPDRRTWLHSPSLMSFLFLATESRSLRRASLFIQIKSTSFCLKKFHQNTNTNIAQLDLLLNPKQRITELAAEKVTTLTEPSCTRSTVLQVLPRDSLAVSIEYLLIFSHCKKGKAKDLPVQMLCFLLRRSLTH